MPLARICPGGIRQLMSLPETILRHFPDVIPKPNIHIGKALRIVFSRLNIEAVVGISGDAKVIVSVVRK